MSDEVEMIIGGKKFTGWTQVNVSRSMETLSGRFSFISMDPWNKDAWELFPQQDCVIRIDKTK